MQRWILQTHCHWYGAPSGPAGYGRVCPCHFDTRWSVFQSSAADRKELPGIWDTLEFVLASILEFDS
jgi:hypothetical protein